MKLAGDEGAWVRLEVDDASLTTEPVPFTLGSMGWNLFVSSKVKAMKLGLKPPSGLCGLILFNFSMSCWVENLFLHDIVQWKTKTRTESDSSLALKKRKIG